MTTQELIEDCARRTQLLLRSNPPDTIAVQLYCIADNLTALLKQSTPNDAELYAFHPYDPQSAKGG